MLNYLRMKLLWENNGFRGSDNQKLRIRRSFINFDKMELVTPGAVYQFSTNKKMLFGNTNSS